VFLGTFAAMNRSMLHWVALVAGIAPTTLVAQRPLFEDSSTLDITLRAPFGAMSADQDGRFTGLLAVNEDGASDSIPIELTLRGKARVRTGICKFPGLMLFFDDSAADTPFEGQDALPMVTHCNDRDQSEQYMLLEFYIYRAYNELTNLSLAVRLAKVTYIDSNSERIFATRYAFFNEHWDHLAERSGWTYVRAPVIPPEAYDGRQRSIFEVFQYFVGNTDWSFAYAAPDEAYCCHNAIPIGNPAGPVFPVPFDFDQAGIVDPPYAKPAESLGIRTVRQRLYRGICESAKHLDATFELFRTKQEALYDIFRKSQVLNTRSMSRTMSYLDDFYATIDDERKVKREFSNRCRTN
jgi:hypothetical protein